MKLRKAALATALLFASLQSAWAEIRVAVMPFDNAGGDEFEQLGVGLQSMVTTDLSQVDDVKVVERGKLQTLIGEMELATTGVVDPVTAAKLGKVAGATHVVAGSFTVVGENMRLDARLVNVQSGEAVGVSSDGEKEAFFELQKDMVKELLKVIGAELSPKERAAISRIHTADFDSFSDFSKGVALFDASRYDEALAVLKEVSEKDSFFTLADVTADQVADAQKRAADKARAARVTEAEADFVAHQESARWEAEQFGLLRKVAFDPQAEMADRVSAAMKLVVLTRRVNTGGFHELRYVSDNFALQRVGDRSFQVIWALLDPEVPRWFPRFRSPAGMDQERGWDAKYTIEQTRSNLFESDNRYKNLANCTLVWGGLDSELATLWLPQSQLYDAYAAQLRKSLKCQDMDSAKIRDAERDLAEKYIRIGAVAKAASILDRQADETAEARELEYIARTLAEVQSRAEIIEKAKSPEAKELARFSPRYWDDALKPEKIPHFLHYGLRREFPHRDPFFLADLPMWILSRGEGLGSGPRTGWDTSRSLRHYGDTRTDFGFDRTLGSPDVVVLLGTQQRDGTLSVDLTWKPTPEWHPHASRAEGFTLLQASPRAGVLVGMTDVSTPATCDPVDESDLTEHPLTAIAAYADAGELVIARVQGQTDKPSCRSLRSLEAVTVEPVAKKPLKKAEGTLSVTVKGKTVTAKLGKSTVSWEAPAEVVGFVGLYAEGEGYVELAEPRWKP